MLNSATPKTRRTDFAWLSASVVLIGLALSFSGPYISLFGTREIHMTPLALGVYLTIVSSSGVLVSTLLARVSDRSAQRKGVLLLALLAATLGYVCLAVLRSYAALLICATAFLGLGAAAFPQFFAFARTQLEGSEALSAEQGLTSLRSMYSLAWVIGPLGGSLLLEKFGFTGLFLGVALSFALAGVPVLLLPARRVAAVNEQPQLEPVTAVPLRGIAVVTLSFVLFYMANAMGMSWLPIRVTQSLHLPTSAVGFLVGLCALLEIPVMLTLAFACRRPSNALLIAASFAAYALYFAWLSSAGTLGGLMIAQGLRAIVIGITASIGMAYFQELLPQRTGVAITLFANTMNLGAMLAGVSAGAVVQVFGLQQVFVVCATLSALAGMLLIWNAKRFKTRV